MVQIQEDTLRLGYLECLIALQDHGNVLKTKSWQGDENPPAFHELLMLQLQAPMYNSFQEINANLPIYNSWVQQHFEERISGEPLNPPPSHEIWLTNTHDYLNNEKFSHSYPERIWPKSLEMKGVRFNIGDLSDAINLIRCDPTTRQCYVPIWFPEDITAANLGERVPCTLGWHFINRDGRLHCQYPMRSTDALRHFANDLAFANLLTLYIIDQAGLESVPGNICFTSSSFHVFENDSYSLDKTIERVSKC